MLFNTATGRKIINVQNITSVEEPVQSQIYPNRSSEHLDVHVVRVYCTMKVTKLCFESSSEAESAFLSLSNALDN